MPLQKGMSQKDFVVGNSMGNCACRPDGPRRLGDRIKCVLWSKKPELYRNVYFNQEDDWTATLLFNVLSWQLEYSSLLFRPPQSSGAAVIFSNDPKHSKKLVNYFVLGITSVVHVPDPHVLFIRLPFPSKL